MPKTCQNQISNSRGQFGKKCATCSEAFSRKVLELSVVSFGKEEIMDELS